jgi:hypothetical protein
VAHDETVSSIPLLKSSTLSIILKVKDLIDLALLKISFRNKNDLLPTPGLPTWVVLHLFEMDTHDYQTRNRNTSKGIRQTEVLLNMKDSRLLFYFIFVLFHMFDYYIYVFFLEPEKKNFLN